MSELSVSSRCDEYVAIPVPVRLKAGLQRIAARDCSSVAAAARRLLARGIEAELSTADRTAASQGVARG